MTTTFKNVGKANNVAINVGQRVVNGIANTSLSCQIDHPLRLVSFKGVLNGLTVDQVDAQMGVVRVLGVTRKTSLFKCRIVIVVVVIDANDCVATF